MWDWWLAEELLTVHSDSCWLPKVKRKIGSFVLSRPLWSLTLPATPTKKKKKVCIHCKTSNMSGAAQAWKGCVQRWHKLKNRGQVRRGWDEVCELSRIEPPLVEYLVCTLATTYTCRFPCSLPFLSGGSQSKYRIFKCNMLGMERKLFARVSTLFIPFYSLFHQFLSLPLDLN